MGILKDFRLKDLNKAVGIVILRLRAKFKLSQEALALKSGLSSAYISKLENGKSMPTILTTKKIAKVFNLTASELVCLIELEYCKI